MGLICADRTRSPTARSAGRIGAAVAQITFAQRALGLLACLAPIGRRSPLTGWSGTIPYARLHATENRVTASLQGSCEEAWPGTLIAKPTQKVGLPSVANASPPRPTTEGPFLSPAEPRAPSRRACGTVGASPPTGAGRPDPSNNPDRPVPPRSRTNGETTSAGCAGGVGRGQRELDASYSAKAREASSRSSGEGRALDSPADPLPNRTPVSRIVSPMPIRASHPGQWQRERTTCTPTSHEFAPTSFARAG